MTASGFGIDDLGGLLDDAAVFPPGNAALDDAVRAHLTRRVEPWAGLVGPLVVAAGQVPGLAAALDGVPADAGGALPLLRVSVVVRDLGLLPEVVRGVGADRRLELHAVELAVAGAPGTADAVTAAARHVPAEVGVWVEPGWNPDLAAAMDLLVAAGHRLKLRTGGTAPEAFPTEQALARAMVEAAGRSLPFKATAGLHHAVRHRDPVTGFEHHGFANLLLAAARADGGEAVTRAALAEHSGEAVADALREARPRGCARRARAPVRLVRHLRRGRAAGRPARARAAARRRGDGVSESGRSWVPVEAGSPWGVQTLAYGVGAVDGGPRVVVRIGDLALDVATVARTLAPELVPLLDAPSSTRCWRQGRTPGDAFARRSPRG